MNSVVSLYPAGVLKIQVWINYSSPLIMTIFLHTNDKKQEYNTYKLYLLFLEQYFLFVKHTEDQSNSMWILNTNTW